MMQTTKTLEIMDTRTHISKVKVACSKCSLRKSCILYDMNDADMLSIEEVVSSQRKVFRGDSLFQTGEKFKALYVIRSGFFKSTFTSPDGREQVMGFQMAGEMLGLDGIVNDKYSCDAIALEDAEVCEMNFEHMEEMSHQIIGLQRRVLKILSLEIFNDHSVMLLLGSMRAEERLATFLVNLVHRLHARGFSPTELVLRMTREEIGSYLGMKLETVSRTFSKLSEEGIVEVNQRHVRILNPDALKRLVTFKE